MGPAGDNIPLALAIPWGPHTWPRPEPQHYPCDPNVIPMKNESKRNFWAQQTKKEPVEPEEHNNNNNNNHNNTTTARARETRVDEREFPLPELLRQQQEGESMGAEQAIRGGLKKAGLIWDNWETAKLETKH